MTGRSGKQVLAAFETRHGGFPGSPYWAHTYDATTILLSAIEAVAVEDGDRLHLDRAALRKQVGATAMSGPGRDAILRPVRRLRHGADQHLPPHGQERHRRFQAAGGLRIQPLSRQAGRVPGIVPAIRRPPGLRGGFERMPVSGHPELEVLVGADLGQRTQLEPVVLGRQFKLQVFGGCWGDSATRSVRKARSLDSSLPCGKPIIQCIHDNQVS